MDHAESLSSTLEGIHAARHLLLRVTRTELHADSCLSFGDDGEAEADHEDVLLQHAIGELSGQSSITQPHRRDRTVVVAQNLESCCLHGGAEELCVGIQLRNQRTAFVEHLVGLEGGAHNGGSDRVRKKVGARPIPEHIHHFAAGSHETTRCASHGLSQSGTDEVDLAVQSEEFRGSFAGLSDEASSVALVHIDVGVVLLGQFVYLVQGGNVSIHGEDAICDDDPHTRLLCLFELFLQVSHIQMFEAVLLGLAETDAVDDGCMIECIADDCIFGAEDGLEEACVGVEAAGEEDGVFQRVIVCDDALQLLVDILCAADEANGAHAESVGVEGALGSSDETGVVGEAEVVVGAEVENGLAVCGDFSELWGGDDALGLVGACLLHGLHLLCQVLLDELDDLATHIYFLLSKSNSYPTPQPIESHPSGKTTFRREGGCLIWENGVGYKQIKL